MEQIIIRKASLEDLEVLLRFEQSIILAERPYDSTLKTGHIHYYDLEKMLGALNTEVVVAQTGSQIIGSGYARIENSKPYLKHNMYAYLGFMYVDLAYRGKGVNQKIIEFLKQWAVSNGVSEIRLEVYFDNVFAIRAYEKAGFAKHMIEMRLGLEDS